jgi:hypothetical protein
VSLTLFCNYPFSKLAAPPRLPVFVDKLILEDKMRNHRSVSPHYVPVAVLLIALLLVTAVSLACNAPADSSQSLQETQMALNVQGTQLALQATAQSENNAQPVAPTQVPEVQDTAAPPPPPTEVPPSPVPTDVPPEPTETQTTDIDALIKDSKILLFENVVKIPLPRYIKQALDNMGLSHNYVDVRDATGNFKAELLSGTDWDLILVGVEARSSIEGEFFQYFGEQVNKGTAMVIELWDLDEIYGANAKAFMTNCGVELQSDWYDPPQTSRSIWWLYGEHPVFHEPNEGISLVNYSTYWNGDAGDLIRTTSGGNATLLAGIYAQEKNRYGVLAICHDDRVIVQTFSSHDYHQNDVVRLWENYIYNTLRAHFEYELSQ